MMLTNSFSVIVTLGPSLLEQQRLEQISALGECIFRINGAHANAEVATNMIHDVRSILPSAKIMIDLPGNKIRTQDLSDPIRIEKGVPAHLRKYQVNYPGFFELVKVGDTIYADDSNLILAVENVESETLTFLPKTSGQLRTNKGLHVRNIHGSLPFLFERDLSLIKAACECEIDYISLSYIRNRHDVLTAKEAVRDAATEQKPQLIGKIETAAALEDLDGILGELDIANVDRGDMASDIGILNIPRAQQKIIAAAKWHGTQLFLATQFMKNMEVHPTPLISEVCALTADIEAGISGIQLSEETAIGNFPVECVKLVFECAQTVHGSTVPVKTH